MVNGRHYGRRERGIRVLPDAEVLRLHQVRAQEAEHIERALGYAVASAHGLPNGSQTVGRLVVVAEPAPIRRADLMADVYAGSDWWRWQQEANDRAADYVRLQEVRSPVLAECLYSGGAFSPLSHLRGGTRNDRQPRGVTVYGGPVGATDGHSGALDLDESGAVRLGINSVLVSERNTRVLDWHFVISASGYVVGMFQQICEKSCSPSQVDVGVYLDDLAGVIPTPPLGRFGQPARDTVIPYGASAYRHTTRITVPEMRDSGDGASVGRRSSVRSRSGRARGSSRPERG
jgi:hypothetical protein